MIHNVGDYVRITANHTGHGYEIGEIIQIKFVIEKCYEGPGCWSFNENECELVQPFEMEE